MPEEEEDVQLYPRHRVEQRRQDQEETEIRVQGRRTEDVNLAQESSWVSLLRFLWFIVGRVGWLAI